MNKAKNSWTDPASLVVLFGIGLVLLALGASAAEATRVRSRELACEANLRSIGVACMAYAQDVGYFPATSAPSSGDTENTAPHEAFGALYQWGYLEVLDDFVCPYTDHTVSPKSTQTPVAGDDYRTWIGERNCSYNYVRELLPASAPATWLLAADRFGHHTEQSWDVGFNLLYADGRTEHISLEAALNRPILNDRSGSEEIGPGLIPGYGPSPGDDRKRLEARKAVYRERMQRYLMGAALLLGLLIFGTVWYVRRGSSEEASAD